MSDEAHTDVVSFIYIPETWSQGLSVHRYFLAQQCESGPVVAQGGWDSMDFP